MLACLHLESSSSRCGPPEVTSRTAECESLLKLRMRSAYLFYFFPRSFFCHEVCLAIALIVVQANTRLDQFCSRIILLLPASLHLSFCRSSCAPRPRHNGCPAGRRECGYAVCVKHGIDLLFGSQMRAVGVVLSVADSACSLTALAMSITFTARPPTPLHTTASTRAHMSICSRTHMKEERE